jgi:uncharacterized membrane protein (UPF0182 family)
MEPTLQQALQSVFGISTQSAPPPPVSPQTGGNSEDLSEARQALSAAEKALADGDWNKFGEAMQQLQQLPGR